MFPARVASLALLLTSFSAADDVATLAGQLATDRARDAADRLAELGPAAKDAVPQLTVALGSEDAELRWRAAWALSRIGPDAGAAAQALVTAARRKDGLPAAAARIALKRIGRAATDAVVAAMPPPPEEGSLLRTVGERERYLGLLRIVEPDPETMVPVLVPFLSDDETSWIAASVLADMGPEAALAVPALVRLLREDPTDIWADRTLVAIGEASVAPLRKIAMDATAEPYLRAEALGLLVRIGGTGLAAAMECLSRPLDDGRRWPLLRCLADAGPAAADLAPWLAEQVAKGECGWGWGAAHAFVAMGPAGEEALERLLFKGPDDCRASLARQLGGSQCGRTVPWLFRLADPSEPFDVRHAALSSLADSRLDADQSRRAAGLAEGALGEDPETACELAGSLGPAGLPLAKKMKPLLGDKDLAVRASAASALCRIGGGGEAEASILGDAVKRAGEDPKRTDYNHALRCLAAAGLPAAAHYELLLDALSSEDVHHAAVEGLARMLPALGENKWRVIEAISEESLALSCVEDPGTLIEVLPVDALFFEAIERLVELGPPCREALVAALDSDDPRLRGRAAQALLRIDAPNAGERAWLVALGGGPEISWIADTCRAQPQVAIPHLMTAVRGNDATARRWAALFLGEIVHRDALPVIRDLVAHDPDQSVRVTAIWALDALLAAP